MKQTIRNLHEALDFILAERDEITEGTFSTRDLARREWDFLPPAKRSKGPLTATIPGEQLSH